MSAAIAQELRFYARQRWPLANDKYRKQRLAGLLQMTARRVKSLWEGEQTAVARRSETDAIEALIGKRIEAQIDEANRDTFRDLQSRIARLEAALFQQDEAFHSDQMAGLREATGPRRGGDVPRAAGRTDPNT